MDEFAAIDRLFAPLARGAAGAFDLRDDAAAFDSFYQAQSYLHETCGERYAIPPLARKVFLAGYKGNPKLKPGSKGGFYDFLGIDRSAKKT